MCRVNAILISVLLAGFTSISCAKIYNNMEKEAKSYKVVEMNMKNRHVPTISKSVEETEVTEIATEVIEETEPTEVETIEEAEVYEEDYISNDDVELIALVTMAEAEGECEEGKRLVIDTILNRVDSEYFPNNISEVIYQPGQFTSMWNGRADICYPSDDICQLVKEEVTCRTNYDVMFFTAGYYSNYGVPMFAIGDHFFSSYE